MKNNSKAIIAFLGSILLLLGSCQQGPKKEGATDPETPDTTQETNVEPPSGIISLEESKSLYDNYTRHRLDLIKQYEAERSEVEFIPARFTSFAFGDIKQYMAFIEQEAKAANVTISSLRIYFANYPDKPDFPDGQKVVHPRQNSLFIVPTMVVDGQEYGFYIGADGKAKLIKDAVGAKEMGSTGEKNRSYASFAPSFFQNGDTSLNLNHGSSGPPPNTDF